MESSRDTQDKSRHMLSDAQSLAFARNKDKKLQREFSGMARNQIEHILR
jgi:hypothetical protein